MRREDGERGRDGVAAEELVAAADGLAVALVEHLLRVASGVGGPKMRKGRARAAGG